MIVLFRCSLVILMQLIRLIGCLFFSTVYYDCYIIYIYSMFFINYPYYTYHEYFISNMSNLIIIFSVIFVLISRLCLQLHVSLALALLYKMGCPICVVLQRLMMLDPVAPSYSCNMVGLLHFSSGICLNSTQSTTTRFVLIGRLVVPSKADPICLHHAVFYKLYMFHNIVTTIHFFVYQKITIVAISDS